MRDAPDFPHSRQGTPFSLLAIWGLIFLGTILVNAPWDLYHGVFLSVIGLLILLSPGTYSIPKVWCFLALGFLLFSLLCFLPRGWFPDEMWRKSLESLGVETGNSVVIQVRSAIESLSVFIALLCTGLWISRHRASGSQAEFFAMIFTWGVALFAIASRVLQVAEERVPTAGDPIFGFFPNRNHSATYLAMGAICGGGCFVQAVIDKKPWRASASAIGTGICLWAVAAWSISRGGILLIGLGILVWIVFMGKSLFQRQTRRVLGLAALAIVGIFFLTESAVKTRIVETMAKSEGVLRPGRKAMELSSDSASLTKADIDFRVPTAIDTLDLISDYSLTGIGAGQFRYIFPQYRNQTAVSNETDHLHPESDWLWMASEAGVPATVLLALLVFWALVFSARKIHRSEKRALRGGLLAAAVLVPLHGIFDVPGHRIALAFGAVFLFCLSLPSYSGQARSKGMVSGRFLALIPLLAGCAFLSAYWTGWPVLATTLSEKTLIETSRLYRQDKMLKQAALESGTPYQPNPAADPLEKALSILSDASRKMPLDRNLIHSEAITSLYFDDKSERVDRAFAIENALFPTWVAAPYDQGCAWIGIDNSRILPLWQQALLRARSLDGIAAETNWSFMRTAERMRNRIGSDPELLPLIPRLFPDT